MVAVARPLPTPRPARPGAAGAAPRPRLRARATPRARPRRLARRRLARRRLARRRLVIALGAAALALSLLGVVRAASGPPGAPSRGGGSAIAERSYVVRPGDSLWRIARALQPEGDVRPLVDRLAARRGRSPLRPGERVRLP